MKLGSVYPRTDDRSVRGTRSAESRKRVLEGGLDLVLVRGLGREHRGPMSLGADLGGAFEQRHLCGRFARAKLVHDLMRVLHDESGVSGDERCHERESAGERILAGEVGVAEIGEVVQGHAEHRERIDGARDRGEGARFDSERPLDRRGIGAAPVIQCAPWVARRDEDRRRSAAAAHDHHERGVGLVKVGEIMERRQLVERAEVRDWRATAEPDDHAVADARGQRITARHVLRRRDLRANGCGRGQPEQRKDAEAAHCFHG